MISQLPFVSLFPNIEIKVKWEESFLFCAFKLNLIQFNIKDKKYMPNIGIISDEKRKNIATKYFPLENFLIAWNI